MPKQQLLKNYKYVVLDNKTNEYYFIPTEDDFQRKKRDNEFKSGDIVITLISENISVAERVDTIILK